jgi:hypothetical protein
MYGTYLQGNNSHAQLESMHGMATLHLLMTVDLVVPR